MIDYALTRVSEPVLEPVTLAQAQAHILGYNPADDDYIATQITVARSVFETDTGLSLIEQTWLMEIDVFYPEIQLKKPPVRSVESIKYYDVSGELQTLASDRYRVSNKGVISAARYCRFPSVERNRADAIQITFKTGVYGVTSSDPALIEKASADNPKGYVGKYDIAVQAIKIMVDHFYRNRGAIITGTIVSEVPMSYKAIVSRCRVEWL